MGKRLSSTNKICLHSQNKNCNVTHNQSTIEKYSAYIFKKKFKKNHPLEKNTSENNKENVDLIIK